MPTMYVHSSCAGYVVTGSIRLTCSFSNMQRSANKMRYEDLSHLLDGAIAHVANIHICLYIYKLRPKTLALLFVRRRILT